MVNLGADVLRIILSFSSAQDRFVWNIKVDTGRIYDDVSLTYENLKHISRMSQFTFDGSIICSRDIPLPYLHTVTFLNMYDDSVYMPQITAPNLTTAVINHMFYDYTPWLVLHNITNLVVRNYGCIMDASHTTITSLRICSDCGIRSFGIFPNLLHLVINSPRFTRDIQLRVFPKLKSVFISNPFISELDLIYNPELISVHIGKSFTRELDFSYNKKLKYLKLMNYYHDLDLFNLTNLTRLHLHDISNQVLVFPRMAQLTYLYIGGKFNQPLDFTLMPMLRTLTLVGAFNRPLDLSKNHNLVSLHLGDEFDESIILPDSSILKNGAVSITYEN